VSVIERIHGSTCQRSRSWNVEDVAKWVHLFRDRRRFGAGVGRIETTDGRLLAVRARDSGYEADTTFDTEEE
jgi:hypothetical protein